MIEVVPWTRENLECRGSLWWLQSGADPHRVFAVLSVYLFYMFFWIFISILYLARDIVSNSSQALHSSSHCLKRTALFPLLPAHSLLGKPLIGPCGSGNGTNYLWPEEQNHLTQKWQLMPLILIEEKNHQELGSDSDNQHQSFEEMARICLGYVQAASGDKVEQVSWVKIGLDLWGPRISWYYNLSFPCTSVQRDSPLTITVLVLLLFLCLGSHSVIGYRSIPLGSLEGQRCSWHKKH